MIKNNIGAILEQRDITGYKLAQAIGKQSNHVYVNIIKKDDIGGMQIRTLVAVAQALDVEITDLITIEPEAA